MKNVKILDFADLVGRFGETEACRTVEAIEFLVEQKTGMGRLQRSMDERLESALERLKDINFA